MQFSPSYPTVLVLKPLNLIALIVTFFTTVKFHLVAKWQVLVKKQEKVQKTDTQIVQEWMDAWRPVLEQHATSVFQIINMGCLLPKWSEEALLHKAVFKFMDLVYKAELLDEEMIKVLRRNDMVACMPRPTFEHKHVTDDNTLVWSVLGATVKFKKQRSYTLSQLRGVYNEGMSEDAFANMTNLPVEFVTALRSQIFYTIMEERVVQWCNTNKNQLDGVVRQTFRRMNNQNFLGVQSDQNMKATLVYFRELVVSKTTLIKDTGIEFGNDTHIVPIPLPEFERVGVPAHYTNELIWKVAGITLTWKYAPSWCIDRQQFLYRLHPDLIDDDFHTRMGVDPDVFQTVVREHPLWILKNRFVEIIHPILKEKCDLHEVAKVLKVSYDGLYEFLWENPKWILPKMKDAGYGLVDMMHVLDTNDTWLTRKARENGCCSCLCAPFHRDPTKMI